MSLKQDDILRKLDDILNKEAENSKDILNQLSLMIYGMEAGDTSLYHLARLLPEQHLFAVVRYFDDSVIKVPRYAQLREAALLCAVFFLKEHKKLSWAEIHKIIDLPEGTKFNSISMAAKIEKIKDKMNLELTRLMKKLKISSVDELLSSSILRNFDKARHGRG